MAVDFGIAAIGAALAIGLAALGTGYAQAKIGASGMALLAEKEKLRTFVLILVAIPETMIILVYVIAIVILTYASPKKLRR